MSNSNIIVYGSNWCWDCRRSRRWLDQHDIPYKWVNIDRDKKAAGYVKEINQGMRSVPTILFPDGSILVEPSNADLAKKLPVEKNK